MRILCGPKGKDGSRMAVTNACNEKCKYWKECLKEIGKKKLEFEFIEVYAGKYEVEDGIFHLDYKGNKKFWALKRK